MVLACCDSRLGPHFCRMRRAPNDHKRADELCVDTLAIKYRIPAAQSDNPEC